MDDSVNILKEVSSILMRVTSDDERAGGGNTALLNAENEAYYISSILSKSNPILAKAWGDISFLCDTTDKKVSGEFLELSRSIDGFIEQTIENNSVYKPTLDKTSSEIESIIKDFGLDDAWG